MSDPVAQPHDEELHFYSSVGWVGDGGESGYCKAWLSKVSWQKDTGDHSDIGTAEDDDDNKNNTGVASKGRQWQRVMNSCQSIYIL